LLDARFEDAVEDADEVAAGVEADGADLPLVSVEECSEEAGRS